MNRPAPNDDAAQTLVLGIIVGLFLVGAVGNWLVGNAAALIGRGRLLHASLSQAFTSVVHLRQHTADPRLAWSPKPAAYLPGPDMYWASAALMVIVAMVIFAGVILLFSGAGRRRPPSISVRRSGTRRESGWSSPWVLHDLITQAFDRYNRGGEPLDPRLLILLDERRTPLCRSCRSGAPPSPEPGCSWSRSGSRRPSWTRSTTATPTTS